MQSNFYSTDELKELGLKSVGENVMISRKCSIYGGENITIGNHVRIDDFCILSGDITIGNYVHISAYCALYGKAGIRIGNFCGMSARSTIFSASDDFSGEFMISPMVPQNLTRLDTGTVIMNDFCQIGTNSVVMPGVIFGEGAICGALSFVSDNLNDWTINVGIPCRMIKTRQKRAKELSKEII